MKNQYTLTITLEPLSQDEPESTSTKLSASDRNQAIQKFLDFIGQDILSAQSLLPNYKKVTFELKQN
jgi:hypothetical protein